MTSNIRVKICGLKDPANVAAAVEAGAAYLGFNFFQPSPRYVSPAEAAALVADLPVGVCKVAVTVGLNDATLDEIVNAVPLDMLQLHGKESPERVLEVKERYGLPVMKAVGVADESDLEALETYLPVADQILLDAKAPKGAKLPGGNGLTFDWRLIAGRRWPVPWMLSGGLNPANVAEAVARTGAVQLDTASGVESTAGKKDPDKIAAFIEAAK